MSWEHMTWSSHTTLYMATLSLEWFHSKVKKQWHELYYDMNDNLTWDEILNMNLHHLYMMVERDHGTLLVYDVWYMIWHKIILILIWLTTSEVNNEHDTWDMLRQHG